MKDLSEYYHHKPVVWTENQCAKAAKARPCDGLGTPGPRGYCPGVRSGPQRYNGGTSHVGDGNWYPGEVFALPVIPSGYRWDHVTSWGWFIRKA